MGRRKIEIKAIKDDRNRSVTFLKRKGGLFKKAHELSVLCQVDVAVIIFGHNKKLYEYSSSDIGEIIQRHNYYGGANEHKGPADFNGKGGDDEDEDENSIPEDSHSVEPPIMPQQFANQAAFQHMRQGPSASPPIPNGAQFAHVQRQLTPQPPMQMGSRPSSRNAPRMINSSMAQQHMQQPQPSPPVNGFTYMNQPPMYAQHAQGMPPHSQAPQQPSFQYTGPPPQQHPQLQQVYLEEQRRSSMPPSFPQHERQNSGSINTPPMSHHQLPSQQQQHAAQQMHQHQQQAAMHHAAQQEQARQQQAAQQQHAQQLAAQQQLPPPPQPQPQQPAPQAQMLEPVKRMSVKSRSIFTPIDESRSILSQHWASSTTTSNDTRPSEPQRSSSSSSITTTADNSTNKAGNAMKSPPRPSKRNISVSSTSTAVPSSASTFGPPSRTNSGLGGAKRPRLKVQIPDEASEGEAATGSTNSPREGTTAAETATTSQPPGAQQRPMVLPPPQSPSTNSILSAGASGPPNPFARPLPPQSNPSRESLGSRDGTMLPGSRDRDSIETPVSALPSRFMNNDFLPSPSTFFADWGLGGFRGGADLPSPLNFATPIVGTGPSFGREDSRENARPGTADMGTKRKSPEGEEREEESKRAKLEP